MGTCRLCGQAITDDGETKRQEWCSCMRRLLILETVQPEDHHARCFISALMSPNEVTAHHATILPVDVLASYEMTR